MRLRTYEDGDIDRIFEVLREADKKTICGMGGYANSRRVISELIKVFPTQVFETEDGEIAALFVAMRKWDGVVEIIAYTGEAVESNRVGFYRACCRGIEFMVDILKLHKLECTVWGDYQRSIKWLERLGFEKEGYMKQHGPDKSDATIMGRVF